jgi:hypothetical protein
LPDDVLFLLTAISRKATGHAATILLTNDKSRLEVCTAGSFDDFAPGQGRPYSIVANRRSRENLADLLISDLVATGFVRKSSRLLDPLFELRPVNLPGCVCAGYDVPILQDVERM